MRRNILVFSLTLTIVVILLISNGISNQQDHLVVPSDSPEMPSRGFYLGVLPIPADGQSFEEVHREATQTIEFVPVWGQPTPFYTFAETLSSPWGDEFVEEFIRGNGLFPLIHLSFIGLNLTLVTPPGLETATLNNSAWRQAYKAAVLDVVHVSSPLYLSIGNEVNRWYEKYGVNSSSPNGFQHFVSLYEEIYTAVKEVSPETLIFCTFAREIVAGLREADLRVLSLFDPNTIDILVFTSYPHAIEGINTPQDIPDNYFVKALDFMPGKPFGLSELGWPSLTAFGGESGQADFIEDITTRLTIQQGINLHFLGWAWLHDLDETDHLGLIQRDGTQKIAYAVWETLSHSEES